MRSFRPIARSAHRPISPRTEALEERTLLSGSSSSVAQAIAIQVPSAYVSQQSDQFDVTLVRTAAGGRSRGLGSLTVDFAATYGSLPAGSQPAADVAPATVHARQSVGHVSGRSEKRDGCGKDQSGGIEPRVGAGAAQRDARPRTRFVAVKRRSILRAVRKPCRLRSWRYSGSGGGSP